jgi:hypothetical protein
METEEREGRATRVHSWIDRKGRPWEGVCVWMVVILVVPSITCS